MSWFEQGTSKARRAITQFHRPAELKLKRMGQNSFPPCSYRTRGMFYFLRKAGTTMSCDSCKQKIFSKRWPPLFWQA